MAHSTRYLIGQALKAEMETLATAQSVTMMFNPKLPVDSKGRGNRIIYLVDRGDSLIEQPGQREKRKSRWVLGVLAVTASADSDADELHFAARDAIKAMRQTLAALKVALVREIEVDPELRETGADGALLLSAYEIEYQETYPSAAR